MKAFIDRDISNPAPRRGSYASLLPVSAPLNPRSTGVSSPFEWSANWTGYQSESSPRNHNKCHRNQGSRRFAWKCCSFSSELTSTEAGERFQHFYAIGFSIDHFLSSPLSSLALKSGLCSSTVSRHCRQSPRQKFTWYVCKCIWHDHIFCVYVWPQLQINKSKE